MLILVQNVVCYSERFRVALDRNWLASRDIFENHHLAVNVTNVAWGSWAYFGRFGWSGPSEKVKNKAEEHDGHVESVTKGFATEYCSKFRNNTIVPGVNK